MQLSEGQTVNLSGTVQDRQVRHRGNGTAHAHAVLVTKDGDRHLPVVWWEAGSAPPNGSHVRIKGRIKKFKGRHQLHADETSVDWSRGEDGSLSSVAAFYRACVEAEAANRLRLSVDDGKHVVLDDVASPLHETLSFTEASTHYAWFEGHRKAVGEDFLAGWPLVVGKNPDDRWRNLAASPLLIAHAELEVSDGTWKLHTPGVGIDLNPFALDLLGLRQEARDEVLAEVDAIVEVEESGTPTQRMCAILQTLEDQGIEGLECLDPAALSPVPNAQGIHNAGVIMAAASTRIYRNLITDLEQIANYPELLSSGPAAILLGQAPAAEVPLPGPHPVIEPSSLYQDQTIHSAMVNDFTVVTGPPGTGKSQVLVNVVAAAVARRDKVLFASKNNRAVDIVVDRLRKASPGSIVIRAGTTDDSSKTAESIVNSLSRKPQDVDSVGVRDAWEPVERSLLAVYRSFSERRALEMERDACKSALTAILDRLPPGIHRMVEYQLLDTALADACRALDAFSDHLWWLGRRRRHHRRLVHAREALHRVIDILGWPREEVEACLNAVAGRPVRTSAPRRAFQWIEQAARDLLESAGPRRRIDEIETRLSELPRGHELEDQLHELGKARRETGLRFLDARWQEVPHEDPEARIAASKLAECFGRMAAKPRDARREVFQILPSALPALPVWAVSNMSARTNLPLQPGLFDLVVIDEASQCDVASALPLLVRGKRALIIGDRQQLIHITSLKQGRERILGRKSGLTDAQTVEISYTDQSCFTLASSRVSPRPLFLDLHFRSHPAIIGFSNQRFYNGALTLCSKAAAPEGMRAVQWVRVPGASTRGPDGQSRMNEAEAREVVQTVVSDLATCKDRLSVGIVTPYVAQMRRIRELLQEKLTPDERKTLLVATAHKFQGDERDVMYFSPVIDRSMSASQVRFAANPNLVNVAVTRACRRLVIVGDPDACLAHDNALHDLADYVLRLQESGLQSPLELELYKALRKNGIAAQVDVTGGGHRLGLAVEHNGIRLDIECDGVPFPVDEDGYTERDQAVEAAGWSVVRFSGRALGLDLDACLKTILDRIAVH